MISWLSKKTCDWFHAGGDIKRDPYDRINWQCRTCGRWQEELARHVAYLPILCELANVDEGELHRAIEIHFYVRSMSKGAMQ